MTFVPMSGQLLKNCFDFRREHERATFSQTRCTGLFKGFGISTQTEYFFHKQPKRKIEQALLTGNKREQTNKTKKQNVILVKYCPARVDENDGCCASHHSVERPANHKCAMSTFFKYRFHVSHFVTVIILFRFHAPHSPAHRTSVLNFFLYLRISGVSLCGRMLVGLTLTTEPFL